MSKKQPIRYKETLAMPGSQLHSLLEDAAKATGKDKQDLLKKAQLSYSETEERDRQLMARYKNSSAN